MASSAISATVSVDGFVTATSASATGFTYLDPAPTENWSLSGWGDFSSDTAQSFQLVGSLGDNTSARSSPRLGFGSIGMDANSTRYGRVYASPSYSTNASRSPTNVLNQGPVHFAVTVEHIAGTTRMVRSYVNGVPLWEIEVTLDTLTPATILYGDTEIIGRLEDGEKYANIRFDRVTLTPAQVSSRYLSERSTLRVSAPKMLVMGSFDSLTAFTPSPFWASGATASLRPGTHFMLDAIGGSKYGSGAASDYINSSRQGLRREVLENAAQHYDKVVWLCQFGTNDLVSGVMDPTSATWAGGRTTIDSMIASDVASVSASVRSKIDLVAVTVQAHGSLSVDRDAARLAFNADRRLNFTSQGYDYLLDLASYVPAGFASMEAAAADAISSSGNTVYVSDGIHWSTQGGADAAAALYVPFIAARLAET